MRTVFPDGLGFKDGNGRSNWMKRALAAVEIARGRTVALARGNESGTVDIKISLTVL